MEKQEDEKRNDHAEKIKMHQQRVEAIELRFKDGIRTSQP